MIQGQLKAGTGKWKGFGLVRDASGKPKIEIRDMLTDAEYFDIYGKERKG